MSCGCGATPPPMTGGKKQKKATTKKGGAKGDCDMSQARQVPMRACRVGKDPAKSQLSEEEIEHTIVSLPKIQCFNSQIKLVVKLVSNQEVKYVLNYDGIPECGKDNDFKFSDISSIVIKALPGLNASKEAVITSNTQVYNVATNGQQGQLPGKNSVYWKLFTVFAFIDARLMTSTNPVTVQALGQKYQQSIFSGLAGLLYEVSTAKQQQACAVQRKAEQAQFRKDAKVANTVDMLVQELKKSGSNGSVFTGMLGELEPKHLKAYLLALVAHSLGTGVSSMNAVNIDVSDLVDQVVKDFKTEMENNITYLVAQCGFVERGGKYVVPVIPPPPMNPAFANYDAQQQQLEMERQKQEMKQRQIAQTNKELDDILGMMSAKMFGGNAQNKNSSKGKKK
jgi:hypothetical protein